MSAAAGPFFRTLYLLPPPPPIEPGNPLRAPPRLPVRACESSPPVVVSPPAPSARAADLGSACEGTRARSGGRRPLRGSLTRGRRPPHDPRLRVRLRRRHGGVAAGLPGCCALTRHWCGRTPGCRDASSLPLPPAQRVLGSAIEGWRRPAMRQRPSGKWASSRGYVRSPRPGHLARHPDAQSAEGRRTSRRESVTG